MSSSDLYADCRLCGRNCGVDRTKIIGYCKTGSAVAVSAHLLHFGEEPPISGTKGSGTIFFSGCSLGCCFCQNFQISSKSETKNISIEDLSDIFLELQEKGAHNINLVTPTHFTPSIKNAFITAKKKGFSIPVVYNSSGYDSIANLEFIDEIVDIYLPDFKFIKPDLSKKYCKAENYPELAKKNIEFMMKKKGYLRLNGEIAVSGVLIRHLVMPSALDNTIEIIKYLNSVYGKKIWFSAMSQYLPKFNAYKHPEINRALKYEEYSEIENCLLELDLDNAFLQELSSREIFFPDFTESDPFNPKTEYEKNI
ncbi:MAG TPA: radical SAM protein [bacterium]|nr:radical SAM protein [bacterium]HPN30870.1 radical SAM protein [bacterium]